MVTMSDYVDYSDTVRPELLNVNAPSVGNVDRTETEPQNLNTKSEWLYYQILQM